MDLDLKDVSTILLDLYLPDKAKKSFGTSKVNCVLPESFQFIFFCSKYFNFLPGRLDKQNIAKKNWKAVGILQVKNLQIRI